MDVFMIWTAGLDSLNHFLQNLYNFSPLKFTNTTSISEIDFLDIALKIQNGQIRTSVHIQLTNHLKYLHHSSEHPTNTKTSTPYI